MKPEAKKVIDELEHDLDSFQDAVLGWDNYDQDIHADLVARATVLAKDDVIYSSLVLAKLASVIGDFVEYNRWHRNITNNCAHDIATQLQFMHFVNHGFSSKAQGILMDAFANRAGSNLMNIVDGALAVGAFNSAFKAVEESDSRHEVIVMTKTINKLKSSFKVVSELKLKDCEIGNMFDVAGEIIRENRLTWSSNTMPIIALNSDEGGPAMSVEWEIGVTPTKAAELTWELTDRLVDRNFDRSGFSIGFFGIDLK